MPTKAIGIDLQLGEECQACFLLGGRDRASYTFRFACAKQAFQHSIVPTLAFARHACDDPRLLSRAGATLDCSLDCLDHSDAAVLFWGSGEREPCSKRFPLTLHRSSPT